MTIGDELLLVDTGFFFALYNQRDDCHSAAREKVGWLDKKPIVLPWPVLYETVNTRFSRNQTAIANFNALVEQPRTTLLDDAPYRDDAFRRVMSPAQLRQPLSLVDAILCAVIEDPNVRIRAMLTFNRRDFSTICPLNSVSLL